MAKILVVVDHTTGALKMGSDEIIKVFVEGGVFAFGDECICREIHDLHMVMNYMTEKALEPRNGGRGRWVIDAERDGRHVNYPREDADADYVCIGIEDEGEIEMKILDLPSSKPAAEPWAEIRWFDEDLETVLEEQGIPVTDENVRTARDVCRGIFSDHSREFEMIGDAIYAERDRFRY